MSLPEGTAKGSTAPEEIAALADVCRSKGIAVLCIDGLRIEMGHALVEADAREPMSAEERARADKAFRLKRLLGRTPTPTELDVLP